MSLIKILLTIISIPIMVGVAAIFVVMSGITFLESKNLKDFAANCLILIGFAFIISIWIWMLKMNYLGF